MKKTVDLGFWSVPIALQLLLDSTTILCPSASTAQTLALMTASKVQTNSSPSEQSLNKHEMPRFEEVFKQPRNLDSQKVFVPLTIENQSYGQVMISLKGSEVEIQAIPLLHQLADRIHAHLHQQLKTVINIEGNIALDALQANGLIAVFDQHKLELQIQIPPAQRRAKITQIQPSNLPVGASDAVPPSRMSGYINLRGDQSFIWSGKEVAQSLGRQPLRLALDGVLNIRGWVVEGQANVVEGGQPFFARTSLRLVRDDSATAVRYIVGDFSAPVTGYQSGQSQIGLSVSKNFALQPYLVTRPLSEFEFFLESPSRVDVIVNGQLERTLQLPAGQQDVRNLPLSGGVNNIELIITDEVGRVRRLSFSSPLSSELLSPGLRQFAYSLGFPATTDSQGTRSYDWQQPVLSLSHRWGVTKQLTIGGYAQGNVKQQLVGVEGAWATSIGNFGWDVALSHRDTAIDYAFRLRYELLQMGPSNSLNRSLRLSFESKGLNFSRVGEIHSSNPSWLDITADYSQTLFSDIVGTLSARYQFNRETQDSYRVGLSLSKNIGRGLAVTLNLSQSSAPTGNLDQRVALLLSSTNSLTRQSIQASTDISSSGGASNRVVWNYNPLNSEDGLQSSLAITRSSSEDSFRGQVAYTNSRVTLSLSHDTQSTNRLESPTSHLTRFNFGTALVFADGYLSWSRPVDNSFALLVPNSNLKGHTIGVNPNSSSGYAAQTNGSRPAVLLSLTPYILTSIQLKAPDLPVGLDLGKTSYTLLPTYKSGTLIRVGTDATVFLRGILQNRAGEPIALKTGQVVSLSDPNWKSIALITNKAGKFALLGLKPGKYKLQLYATSLLSIEFDIPTKTQGLYDIGVLQLR